MVYYRGNTRYKNRTSKAQIQRVIMKGINDSFCGIEKKEPILLFQVRRQLVMNLSVLSRFNKNQLPGPAIESLTESDPSSVWFCS